MRKVVTWILVFISVALISRHPRQIFFASLVLLVITGAAAAVKFLICLLRRNAS